MSELISSSNHKVKLNWSSIINFPSYGYCNSSQYLMKALDCRNVEVSYSYAYGPGTVLPVAEPVSTDWRIKKFQDKPYHDNSPEIVYAQGDVFFKNKGTYKIGYTMLEVDGLPLEWVRQCNLMDEVWVPSQFNVETFQQSGVTVPIYVMPLGIDPTVFNPYLEGTRYSSKFTFLSVFQWQERKNPFLLIEGFLKGFSHYKDVILVLKTTKDVKLDLVRKGYGKYLNSKIIVDHNVIRKELLGTIYRGSDCFVFPTSGEGWGMPILEAMACGIPVIATNWSGQKDFFNEESGYPIRISGLTRASSNNKYYKDFQWCTPDIDHLIELMTHVYENREIAHEKSMKVAKNVLSHYTWDHSAEKIKNRLRQVL